AKSAKRTFSGLNAKRLLPVLRLEFCHFCKVKVPDLHRRHYHVERFLAAGAYRSSHSFDVGEHLNQALVETEITDSVADLSVLHVEGAVAGHAGENLLVRIDFTDVPKSRHQHAAFGRGNHLVNGYWLGRCAEHDVHRGFAHFIWERKAVPGGRDGTDLVSVFRPLHLLGGGAGIHQALDHAVFDQLHFLTAYSFSVERWARLQRVSNVVPDIDVLAEEFASDAVIQERALVENGESAKVEEHEANDVEHGGRLENDGVFPSGNLARACRFECFASRDFCQGSGIQVCDIGRIGFLPTRGIGGQHGD